MIEPAVKVFRTPGNQSAIFLGALLLRIPEYPQQPNRGRPSMRTFAKILPRSLFFKKRRKVERDITTFPGLYHTIFRNALLLYRSLAPLPQFATRGRVSWPVPITLLPRFHEGGTLNA